MRKVARTNGKATLIAGRRRDPAVCDQVLRGSMILGVSFLLTNASADEGVVN